MNCHRILFAMLAVLSTSTVVSAQSALFESEIEASALRWERIDGGSEAWARWDDQGQSFYALSFDGGASAATVRRVDDVIRLRYADFDPSTSGEPDVADALRDGAGGLHIVQFATRGTAAMRAAVENRGGTIVHFVPASGVLVRMDTEARDAVAGLPFVRWVGAYHTAYRLDDESRRELLAGGGSVRKYNIHTTRPGLDEKTAIVTRALELGATPDDYVSPHGYLVTITMNLEQLGEIAARDDVLFIDRWGPEEGDLDIVRQFNGADYVETVAGYTGAGVRAEARDNGLQVDHPNLQRNPAILHGPLPGAGSHGTAVFGICFGSGDDDAQARGIMPDAQGIFQNTGSLPDRFIATGELVQEPYRAIYQTNSTGSTRTFFYTTISADMDFILLNHDVNVLQSQSNAGDQDSRPQAWAKNIISVGGIRHMNTLTEADDAWNGGASIGPADDGRIKPDISAFYDSTYTTTTGSGYTQFGGTSGATPITSAHLGLIHQMWADGIVGNALSSWDVFDNRPSPALAKALLLNSTTQYSFSGAADDLTRVHQGWGRPDVKKFYDRRNRLQWVDETAPLTNLGTWSMGYTVPVGETEFRATMVYRDTPGSPGASMHRINDLTLRVVAPDSTVYFGNNGLLTGTTSTAGGSANLIDTVEQVIVNNPMPGLWVVEVTAPEVNQDSHLATPAVDAAFGLAVSGVNGPTAPPGAGGEANKATAQMQIVDSVNANGQKPKVGVEGPFFLDRSAGDALTFQFTSTAGRGFILMMGPLNSGNADLGAIGQLDIGALGGIGDFSDIVVILNGVTGNSFLDGLAHVGANGNQSLSFTIPPSLPPGVIGAFQTLFWDVQAAQLDLTTACELTIQ